MTDKPLCIDLFCGLGGWAEGFIAEGYDVVGFDIDPRFGEPYEATGGHFVCADVRDLDGREFQASRCIVASPPCNEFSMRFLRRMAPAPSMECIEAVWRIRSQSGRPTVLENVQGAQTYLGKGIHRGSQYLWGDIPLLAIVPRQVKVGKLPDREAGKPSRSWIGPKYLSPAWRSKKDWRRGPDGKAIRAKIPLPLARAVARGFL